ncbi:MAG: monovalent cation/H+ antiporter subunit D family protein [Clostridiaceae bacterium]|jgi:multicomponent Na+:H+ antiporter subunit D|nr:monovalent cation/H+ antiporter subunit D family protein [Clostridiaceae bacterium]
MLYLILALFSGVIGGLVVTLIPRTRNQLRNFIVILFAVSSAIFSWKVAFLVFSGESVRIAGSFGGLGWSIDPDPLGAVFGLIASTLWVFTAIYSFGYMAQKHNQNTYYTFFLVSLSMTLGVAFSGNLVALYLFYELLTFATYPLVIHERSSEAVQAGSKYILYSLSGAGAILIGIVLTYMFAGRLDFADGPILAGSMRPGLGWLLLLFFAGFGVKAAIMPLHRWLPKAMVAPTPVSALLHAVAVVYSGVYGIVRVVYSVFGHELTAQLSVNSILLWIVAFSILAGIIIAMRQDVLKRRLAYQTISHLSYILLGALTLQPWGLAGAIMHMISYSMLKITLFFCAGIISEQTGQTRVSKMSGVGWAMPGTMAVFSGATLGMIGMLPLNAFWGKYYLMKGSVAGGKWPLALVLIGSGILNAVCFIPVIVNTFQGERSALKAKQGGSVALMLVPTGFLVIAALVVGLLPGIVWPGVEAVVNWFF